MAMTLDYAPGMNLSDPLGLVATRATTAYRVTAGGTLAQVASGILRDNHYVNGIKTTLLEVASTNWLLNSQAWNTGWSQSVVTATNNAATAPDGTLTATKLLPNNTVVANNPYDTSASINPPLTADENLAASCFVKANGYNAVMIRFSDAGSVNGFQASFDLANGVFGSVHTGFGTGVLTGFTSVALANGWYWIGLWGALSVPASGSHPTAGQLFCYVYDTIAHANVQTAYVADGVSSVLGWGAQLERWGTSVKGLPTSYIPTTGGTATRNFDVVSMPWPFQTQPMWGYVKLFDLGWSARAAFESLMMFTDSVIGNPSIKLMTGSGTAGLSPNHRINYANGLPGVAGGNQSAAIVGGAANYGDVVELFWQLFADGSVSLQRSINGGAVTTVTNSGASPDFLDFASHNGGTPVFYLSDGATVALTRMKVGFGTAPITTLAQAAAA